MYAIRSYYAPTLREQLQYNIKDCCITHECSDEQQRLLEKDPLSLQNYHNNIHRLPILLMFQLQGIPFDQKEKARLKKEVVKEIEVLQEEINQHWLLSDDGIQATSTYLAVV